jgi:preprotein translocase subunit SecG
MLKCIYAGGGVSMETALMVLEALICIALIACVVMQSGKSSGMSGSIAGGAETILGGKAKTLDAILAKATMVLAGLFAVVTLILGRMSQ